MSGEDRVRYIRTSVFLASDAESARTYYHYASDEMSSVTHVVDGENEEIFNRYEYDAWGSLTTCEEKVHNRFKFNGQQYDPVSQQYYLRTRYYNPVIGRFTQEDSYNVDGLNLYAYCRNNPVYYVDPSGNICETAANKIRAKIANGDPVSNNERRKLAAYERNEARKRAEQYAQVAEDKFTNEYQIYKKYADKTIAYDGNKFAMSGWSEKVSEDAKNDFNRGRGRDLTQEVFDGFTGANGSKENLSQKGYEPARNGRDGKTPYKYNASHAEKQVSMYGNTEIGVSRNMCGDCQNYFAAKAQFHNKEYVVADPTTTHIFTTEGVQIDIDRATNKTTIIRHNV